MYCIKSLVFSENPTQNYLVYLVYMCIYTVVQKFGIS